MEEKTNYISIGEEALRKVQELVANYNKLILKLENEKKL